MQIVADQERLEYAIAAFSVQIQMLNATRVHYIHVCSVQTEMFQLKINLHSESMKISDVKNNEFFILVLKR